MQALRNLRISQRNRSKHLPRNNQLNSKQPLKPKFRRSQLKSKKRAPLRNFLDGEI
jgi:hypothetical protein